MPRKPTNFQTCKVCGQRHRGEEMSLYVPEICWRCDDLPKPLDIANLQIWSNRKCD